MLRNDQAIGFRQSVNYRMQKEYYYYYYKERKSIINYYYYLYYYYYYYEILSSSQFVLGILDFRSHLPPAAQRCNTSLRIRVVLNKPDILAHPVISVIPGYSSHFAKSFETVPRAPIAKQLLPGVSAVL